MQRIKNTDREKRIKHYGIEIVLDDEKIWSSRGFTVNPKTGLLEKNNTSTICKNIK